MANNQSANNRTSVEKVNSVLDNLVVCMVTTKSGTLPEWVEYIDLFYYILSGGKPWNERRYQKHDPIERRPAIKFILLWRRTATGAVTASHLPLLRCSYRKRSKTDRKVTFFSSHFHILLLQNPLHCQLLCQHNWNFLCFPPILHILFLDCHLDARSEYFFTRAMRGSSDIGYNHHHMYPKISRSQTRLSLPQ